MIYPHDVYAKTRRGGKMTDADKAKVVMGGLLAINIGFTVMGAQFINAMGVPLLVVIVFQMVVYIFICIQIFRFMVFREQDRDLEESDLFTPYYKFRPGSTKIKSHLTQYEMYELKNSSYVSVLAFKFGMNNDERTVQNEQFFHHIQDYFYERKLNCRFIVMNENFMESAEATTMLKNANSVSEPQLRAAQLAIYNEVLNFAEKNGSAFCIYLMVYAPNNYLKDDLEDVMVQVVSLFGKVKENTAFRVLSSLNQTELLSVFKQFYGMGAIDLSLSQIQYNAINADILKSIVVYRIISKSGKVYSNSVFDKVHTGVKYIK